MLGLIEQFLLGRLQVDPFMQHGVRPALLAGAVQPPKTGSAACLAVWARSLRSLSPDPVTEDPDRRETARVVRRLTLRPDSTGSGFALPADGFDDTTDQIAELAIDGRQLRAGGDYLLDGRTIRCLRNPGGALVARILGPPARGYVERCATEIELALIAWGAPDGAWDQQVAGSDALLTRGLAVALAAIAGRDVLDLAVEEDAGFELRLLQPRARLGAVSRTALHTDTATGVPSAEALLSLRGEMELTLAHGVPDAAAGEISQVTLDPPAGFVVR
jgi:hypothetical protein